MAEDRVSVWEYINPVSVAGSYLEPFTSPTQAFVYGPYKALGEGRGMLPGLVPTEGWIGGPGRAFARVSSGAWTRMTSASFRAGNVGKFVGSAGKAMLFGAENSLGSEAYNLATGGMRAWRKGLVLSDVAARGPLSNWMTINLAGKAGRGPSAAVFAKAGLIGAGRVINPLINLYMGYQLAAFAVEAAYKGVKTASAIVNRVGERISNMELGGELARGYMSGEAATERQRALQAIQSSHLSGRRFLGNEAELMHS